MNPHINLALVFHQHQPVGNHGFVFEELFNLSYEPLLASLERHPALKAGLHYSGPLLDWLRAERPTYLDRLRALVDRRQVEILGGGYYEPILPAISEADRVGQLVKMRHALEGLFGIAPTGAWLAERVWEPDLPRALSKAGYSWTVVDDVHFEAAGLPASDLHGYYTTEDEGFPVSVFASSTRFRYLVPWGTIDDCIDYLRAAGDIHPGSPLTMADDGEKFGGWPTTHIHCWENGWVDAFFSRLEAEQHWIRTVHPGTWREEHAPTSLAYLPATSYMEMGEWSLPPQAQHDLEAAQDVLKHAGREDLVRFLRGGHWRNFLVRYPEVNLLHKRLLSLSREAHAAGDTDALDHVWQAQCNCPFWHGVFGGVYLEHIRHANFGHAVAADSLLHPGPQPPEVRDWDMDGHKEVCLRGASHLAVIAPDDGGHLLHWDLRKEPWHLTHAIAARPEAYHTGLHAAQDSAVHSIHDGVRVKDPEAVALATRYDRGLRLAAQDTVLAGDVARDAYAELRLGSPTRCLDQSLSPGGERLDLRLEQAGMAYEKSLSVAGDALTVRYALPAADATFFSEWNLSLPAGPDGGDPVFELAPGALTIRTNPFTIACTHNAHDAWVERLYSASNTEGGVELAPQGWSLVFGWAGGGSSREASLSWTVAP